MPTTVAEAPESQDTLKMGAPDLPKFDSFNDINVEWSGWGAETLKAALEKSTASTDGGAKPDDSGTAGEAVVDPEQHTDLNPAASNKEPDAGVKQSESEKAEFSLDTLTESDITGLLDSITAKRLLGPRMQSERDKSYQKGIEAGRAAVEQEVALARAAKTIEFDDDSRAKAQSALHLTRTQTAQQMVNMLSESFGTLAEQHGLERSVADLNGKTFTNMHEYIQKMITEIYEPVVQDRVKREAAAQAKTLAQAIAAKRGDDKRNALPKTPDFLPSTGPKNALNSMEEFDRAFASGDLDMKQYQAARKKFGVN